MLFTLHYADDQVVIADHEDSEFMVKKLYQEYQKWGLETCKKKEHLCVPTEAREFEIEAGRVIKPRDEYTYVKPVHKYSEVTKLNP